MKTTAYILAAFVCVAVCASTVASAGCEEHPCFAGVTCTERVGGDGVRVAECDECPEGYTGDGRTCTDIDECSANPCFPGVSCENLVAPDTGFVCGPCPEGYVGNGQHCKNPTDKPANQQLPVLTGDVATIASTTVLPGVPRVSFTTSGSAPTDACGYDGEAWTFTGSPSQGVEMVGAQVPLANFTIAAWMRWDGAPLIATGTAIRYAIVGGRNGGGTLEHWGITMFRNANIDGGRVYFYHDDGALFRTSIGPTNDLDNGEWRHVAAAFHGGVSVEIFVDGVSDLLHLHSGTGSNAVPALIDPDGPIFIGIDGVDPRSEPWEGLIDDVILFTVPLVESQALTIYSEDVDSCSPQCRCDPNAVCTDFNVPGQVVNSSYTCGPCMEGYSGNGFTCTDVDECVETPEVCFSNCTNTVGSYECGPCPEGYTGDGATCVQSCEALPSSPSNFCSLSCTRRLTCFQCCGVMLHNNTGNSHLQCRTECHNTFPMFAFEDPHFIGFLGQSYDFMGEGDKVYNLISDRHVQVNAFFKKNGKGLTYMNEVGVLAGPEDQIMLSCNPGAGGAHHMVRFNGQLLVPGAYKHTEMVDLQYGVAATRVEMQLAKYKLIIGFAHSEGQSCYVNVEAQYDFGHHLAHEYPHGVLGQTANPEAHSRDGHLYMQDTSKNGENILEGTPSDYEIEGDAVNGVSFHFNKFQSEFVPLHELGTAPSGGRHLLSVEEVDDLIGWKAASAYI